jgi:ribosome-binding protein aMBF1 (putative translation factor)
MDDRKSISEWIEELGVLFSDLLEKLPEDKRTLKAIVAGHYTTSPQQRKRLADALGLTVEQITWGHVEQVTHMYGHGPQFGRSP